MGQESPRIAQEASKSCQRLTAPLELSGLDRLGLLCVWQNGYQREMDARQVQQEQERRAAVEALVFELCKQSDLLVRATLVVAGYHQHDRGAWRFKRVTNSTDRAIGNCCQRRPRLPAESGRER
jgi:hypothetical protein